MKLLVNVGSRATCEGSRKLTWMQRRYPGLELFIEPVAATHDVLGFPGVAGPDVVARHGDKTPHPPAVQRDFMVPIPHWHDGVFRVVPVVGQLEDVLCAGSRDLPAACHLHEPVVLVVVKSNQAITCVHHREVC